MIGPRSDFLRPVGLPLALLCVSGCAPEPPVDAPPPASPSFAAEAAPLRYEILGRSEQVEPLRPPEGVLHCLLFVTVDCPIANKYAPEIQSIVDEHAGRSLRFFIVHVDPDVDATQALAHADAYDLSVELLRDPEHRLVDATGVTITPEVSLHDHSGVQLYRGRIDDRFARLGSRRPEPNHHDLRNALEMALRGERPVPAVTEAVGCLIADFR